jgi:glucosamine kinase
MTSATTCWRSTTITITKHVLGIEGGQTSALAVQVTENGEIVGVGRSGPANHLDEPGGPERRRQALTEAIAGAYAAAGVTSPTALAACCGMTGSVALGADIIHGVVFVAKVRVERDVVTALAGGTAGQPGVVIIAGTGSASSLSG